MTHQKEVDAANVEFEKLAEQERLLALQLRQLKIERELKQVVADKHALERRIDEEGETNTIGEVCIEEKPAMGTTVDSIPQFPPGHSSVLHWE